LSNRPIDDRGNDRQQFKPLWFLLAEMDFAATGRQLANAICVWSLCRFCIQTLMAWTCG